MVLPTASAIQPEEYASIFPELFVQLYYNSAPLKSSLLRVWAKSKRARFHTDLLVMDQVPGKGEISIQKWTYAPEASRPWGIDLPDPASFCSCTGNNWRSRWKRIGNPPKPRFGECFYRYRSGCKHSDVAVAIFVEGLKAIPVDGTQIVIQGYDHGQKTFPLDRSGAFKIAAAVVSYFYLSAACLCSSIFRF